MKKFISLLVCLSMLLCMFMFAPSVSAAEMYGPNGETVHGYDTLQHPTFGTITVSFELECNNGWLDNTNGVDYVMCVQA